MLIAAYRYHVKVVVKVMSKGVLVCCENALFLYDQHT